MRPLGPEPSASANSAISAYGNKTKRLAENYINILQAGRGLSNFASVPRIARMADDPKIPQEIARELRRLAHDLSNALETIVQATYLVSQGELPNSSRRWIEMMDQASQEAATINRKLRDILRSQS